MKIAQNLRAAFLLARSMKRVADALELQNHIHRTELLEMHGIVIPDLTRKWSKQERETEVIYGEQPTPEEEREAEEWTEKS